MTGEFNEALWSAMFAASLSAAALVITIFTYISSFLNTGNPEDEASMQERLSRIKLIFFIVLIFFLIPGFMGVPYARFESLNYTIAYLNATNKLNIIWSISIDKDLSVYLLRISYYWIFTSFSALILFLLLSGIISRAKFSELTHDDVTREKFFEPFMNP